MKMNRACSLFILSSAFVVTSAQDICEKGGGGIFFPIFSNEYDWPTVISIKDIIVMCAYFLNIHKHHFHV